VPPNKYQSIKRSKLIGVYKNPIPTPELTGSGSKGQVFPSQPNGTPRTQILLYGFYQEFNTNPQKDL